MSKHAIVIVVLSSWLAGCATTGGPDGADRGGALVSLAGLGVAALAFSGGEDDCLAGGDCPLIVDNPAAGLGLIAGGLLLGVIGVVIDAPPPGNSVPQTNTSLATTSHERRILTLAATGQCRAAVRQYQELRASNLAAAGRLKLDDHVHTCLVLEDARARGTIRSQAHD